MPIDEATIVAVEQLALAQVADFRLPGLALGLVGEQGLVWCGGFGTAKLDDDVRPNENTIARVASVTKTFTTTAILQLRDEGLLGLDDPLRSHIPEFGQVQECGGTIEGVTLRRLLTHRSGLVTESPTRGWGELNFPSMAEILADLPRTQVVISPDSAWKYSNLGFGLLGEVVHRLTGLAYEDYVIANILEPLQLGSTVFDLAESMRPRFYTGYNPPCYQDRPKPAANAHLCGLAAAGQLHSTVADLSRWVAFQFAGDGGRRNAAQILDGHTLTEMQRPQYLESDWSAGQCLGWRATRIGDRVYHNHGGGIHGFTTQVWFHIPSRTGAIALINMWPAPGGIDLVQQVLELVLGQQQADNAAPAEFDAAPEELERFLGHYCAAPGIHVHIEYRDSRLALVAPAGRLDSLHAPALLAATGNDSQWLVEGGRAAGETASFQFDSTGRVVGYELGRFLFKKYSPGG
jgi:D-alanyl-D-alanine carboxypeptidase